MKKGIPQGTTQLFDVELDRQLRMIETIIKTYRSFGFDRLTTPTMEYEKVFTGHHGEGEDLLFRFQDSKGHKLVLRYDLTVPLARYISEIPDLLVPFKRFQVDTVFRDDEVDKGHLREFTQCDGDTVGMESLTADAEIVDLAYTGLNKLGFDKFTIKVNHRGILDGLAEMVDMGDKLGKLTIQRALDAVSKFFEKNHRNTYPNPIFFFDNQIKEILSGYGLDQKIVWRIHNALSLKGANTEAKLSAMENFFIDQDSAIKGIKDLREIISYLSDDVKNATEIDITLARGADYYTGFIFEGSLDVGIGAVLGGGRFDNLIGDMGGPNLPAVGMAFGLERLFIAATDLNILPKDSVNCVKTIVVPREKEEIRILLDTARKLRAKGNMVDFIPMLSSSMEDIISYANYRGFIHLAVIENDEIVTTRIRK